MKPVPIINALLPLVHQEDRAADYIHSGTYYEWYAAYAQYFRPRRILEIGSRRGYSLAAMLLATDSIDLVVSIDNESYGVTVDELRATLSKVIATDRFSIWKLDSQQLSRLPTDERFDLIHVDGDHTEAGALHDLQLVQSHVAENGMIVLDDVGFYPSVMNAALKWLSNNRGWTARVIPSFRGHILFFPPPAKIEHRQEPSKPTIDIPRFHVSSIQEGMQAAVGDCNGHSYLERWEQETPAFAQKIASHIPTDAATIVDYGCGIGRLSKAILGLNDKIRILGVDASPDKLRLAREYVNDSRFVPMLPWDLFESFDFVYSVYVLQHVAAIELRHVLERIHFFLRPDGKFVCCSSDYRMALGHPQGFFDDACLGVNLRKEITRLFDDEGDLFDLDESPPIVRDMVTAAGCPAGSIPHPAKVYRRKDISRDTPYFRVL